MTREEIIQAISDDKMMPFIQPEQLAEIVDFVIKNYNPSLPSTIDEAVEGVVHHVATAHYIETNEKQLKARLKQFDEGTEVVITINARMEE